MINVLIIHENLSDEKYQDTRNAIQFLEDNGDRFSVKLTSMISPVNKTIAEINNECDSADFIMYVEVEPFNKDKKYIYISHNDSPDEIENKTDTAMEFLVNGVDFEYSIPDLCIIESNKEPISIDCNISDKSVSSLSGVSVLVNGTEVVLSLDDIERLKEIKNLIEFFGYEVKSIVTEERK